jgi:hypothetical protein
MAGRGEQHSAAVPELFSRRLFAYAASASAPPKTRRHFAKMFALVGKG